MTPGQLAIALAEEFEDASIEDLIDAIEVLVKRDKDEYVKYVLAREGKIVTEGPKRDLVYDCLNACENHLSNASLAWYASTK